MKLFESLDDLKPFIFRIVDNGGETYDRITVMTCDGDAILCTTGSICAHIERADPQVAADNVGAGTERDLRWIDLDEGLQRRIIASLNDGFSDWLSAFTPPLERKDAVDYGTGYSLSDRLGEGVYGRPGNYQVRREHYPDDGTGPDDLGPYETLREAVLATLPEDYDMSGPEYHTTVDLWDTEGGPAPLWDREADPPIIDENFDQARVSVRSKAGNMEAWFASEKDAQNWIANHDDDETEYEVNNPGDY